MSGVKDRLDYLEETKNLIKDAIVTSGGTLSDESTLSLMRVLSENILNKYNIL